jgi:putative spermidine/putrescine transport system permease protein
MTVGFRAQSIWKVLRITITSLLVVFLVAPMVIVVIISFSSAHFLSFPPPGFSMQWYRNLFGDPAWADTLTTSIEIVVPSGLLAMTVGTAAALGLSHGKFPGKNVVIGLLMAPIVVPIIIIAAAIYGVYQIWDLNGTMTGFILAHTVLTVPYVVSTVLASLQMMDEQYENAALTLGASPWIVFWRIVLPLILPGVLSGLLFAMVVSFDELVVSLFISSPTVRPVTVKMWSDVLGDINPTIAAIGTLLFLFSLFVLLAEAIARRTSLGADRPWLLGETS